MSQGAKLDGLAHSSSSYESHKSPTSPRRRQTVSQVPAEFTARGTGGTGESVMGQHFSHNQSSLPKLKLNGTADIGPVSAIAIEDNVPRIWGIPLKYISLVTLAVQNASLTIIMHYSRVTTAPSQSYSAASAVFLNELLKAFISLVIAFTRIDDHGPHHSPIRRQAASWTQPRALILRSKRLWREIFSADCWKLSIPAILYVIQNNLQFVAASNLEAATFQVSYQMKILTTAAFSVALLRKRLSASKWAALTALAFGVGIVQIQSGSGRGHGDKSMHEMHPIIGFTAVMAACFTSGLAGVYFEMVLKGSQADLWVRNCQLALFSLIPALLPILVSSPREDGFSISSMFANFGGWAWATVLTQVFGGLVTALVIKYSDNILKAFATSISIVLSFVASIILFNFHITPSFVVGASTVLAATWLYNQPDDKLSSTSVAQFPKLVAGVMSPRKSSFPGTPIESVAPDAPILGETDEKRRGSMGSVSPSVLSAALKLVTPRSSLENLAGHNETLDDVYATAPGLGSRTASMASLSDYHSRYASRSHSPAPAPSAPPSRLQPNSPLAIPTSRSLGSNGQLHPLTYSTDDSQYSIINLDVSPSRPTR